MNRKTMISLFALLCMIPMLVLPAFAAEKKGSLALTCAVGGTKVEGVRCRLYRVGELEGTTFLLSEPFKDSRVRVSGLTTAAQWQTAANSLAVFAAADENGAKPVQQGISDSSGTLSFSNLEEGLYLAAFSATKKNGSTWKFSPALFALPSRDGNGAAVWNVTAAPKGSSKTTPHGGGGSVDRTADLTVLKVWNDGEKGEKVFPSVTVELLKDGSVYDTVVLTEKNNWRHQWNKLSSDSEWTVLERGISEDYTVSYEEDSAVFTITNTATTEIPNNSTPGGNVPSAPEQPAPGKPGSGEKLPQTGQLWWPVPVMAALGLVVFAAGWYLRNREEHEKK